MPGSSPGMTDWSYCSRLELAFQLVQKAPIGALVNDLLRARFDHADFMQAQCVESEGVFVIVFAPFVVRQFTERLQRIIVSAGETAIDELPRGARRIAGADIGRLQDRPHRSPRRDRFFLDKTTF